MSPRKQGQPWEIIAAPWSVAVRLYLRYCLSALVRAHRPSILQLPSFSQTVLSGNAGWIGNSCSRLVASVGQPVAGFSAGGGFTRSAGFRAVAPAGDGDTIFFDSMEECLP